MADHQTPAERRIIEDMRRMGRNGQMGEWADDDDPKLRALFQYQLRNHVRHQDGRDSLAPTLVFADADYEVGDGTCGLHADAKSANEPAIVFVRADALVNAADRIEALEAERDATVAAERKACAKACEDAAYDGTHPLDDMAELGCLRARDRIRARDNTDPLAERDAQVRAEAREDALREAAAEASYQAGPDNDYRPPMVRVTSAILALIPDTDKGSE
jgi:hypothetical protein